MRKNKLLLLSVIVLLLAGVTAFSQAAWIHAKAELAQVLLNTAWQKTLQSRLQTRPWHWADTWPVAKLTVPSSSINIIILDGSNGASLPFAPGHLAGSAVPGERGISIITAHRDTHFEFLRDLAIGERLTVTRHDGKQVPYRIRALEVVDTREPSLRIRSNTSQLLMVTCYPFNAIEAGTPLRYVVTAEAVTMPVMTRM
jgi:sortase A